MHEHSSALSSKAPDYDRSTFFRRPDFARPGSLVRQPTRPPCSGKATSRCCCQISGRGGRGRDRANSIQLQYIIIIFIFIFLHLFLTAVWQLAPGAIRPKPTPACHSNPPSLASCHFPKFVSIPTIFFDRSIHGSPLPPHRGLEHGNARHGLVDVKFPTVRAPICPKVI